MATATGGTLYLVFIQVASRALTFGGNQFLLRFLSPELLGIAVQLELLSVSVLYFSRESLRVALQKQPKVIAASQEGSADAEDSKSSSSSTQSIVNLAYVPILIGLPLTLWLMFVYSRGASFEVTQSPHFTSSLGLYGLATVIELLSEPSFLVIQQRQLYKSRARNETTAAVLKCLSACFTATLMHQGGSKASVLPFAIGQLAYAVTVLAFYIQTVYSIARVEQFSLFLKSISISNNTESTFIFQRFSRSLLSLCATLYAQSIFKQLLTQGDAFILSILAPLSDQGAFALASNYGGLLARLVFQPIEESSRTTFGALLSSPTTTTTANSNTAGDISSHNSTSKTKLSSTQHSAVKAATTHLTSILHAYALLTLLSTTILPHLLPIIVSILAGRRWFTPQISLLLSAYAYYIPLLAYNGILDAFVTAVADAPQLRAQSLAMAACTAAYGAAVAVCLGVLDMGARGLVVANGVGMACRVGWSVEFVRLWVGRHISGPEGRSSAGGRSWWKDALPSAGSVTAAAIVAVALNTELGAAQMPYKGKTVGGVELAELGRVIAAGAFLGPAILFFEREYLLQTISQILPERLGQKLNISRPAPPQPTAEN